jgi:predicted RNA-binding Zn-ribbon protein involved in translation (DUF1610 family)
MIDPDELDYVDICPRCGEKTMRSPDVLNALSRRDNMTYICSGCGMSEAFFDMSLDDYRKSADYSPKQERILKARESTWLLIKEIHETRDANEKEAGKN